MTRILHPEILDSLPAEDPAAVHSRGDLQRLNGWMRNVAHITRAMASLRHEPRTIIELGAGDGTFMLQVARRLRARWKHPVRLTLLDLQPVVSAQTLDAFAAIGWEASVAQENLLSWLGNAAAARADLMVANLFVHHFSDGDLKAVFAGIQARSDAFIACEPRRWMPAWIATRLLWIIGCNHVTRHDARVSVQAGFRDRELSALWPAGRSFRVSERPAGYASHLFAAERDERFL